LEIEFWGKIGRVIDKSLQQIFLEKWAECFLKVSKIKRYNINTVCYPNMASEYLIFHEFASE
jgi:hypothetical protein